MTSEEMMKIWEKEQAEKKRRQEEKKGNGVDLHNSLNSQSEERPMRQWPEPPAPIAYHGLAGEYVYAIDPHTEADKISILVQFLLVFGNLIGRSPYFRVEASHHHTNEFAVLVGSTSKARKGTSWDQVIERFCEADEQWCKNCIGFGLSSGEGLIWRVRDQIEKQEPIKEKGRVVEYQTVIVDPGVKDKRLLVVEAEFANVMKVASRETNTISPVIRLAWDSGNLATMTKNSPARSTDAHISLIGHVTKDELLRYLETTEAANGFANRFMFFCVKRSKVLPEGGKLESISFKDHTTELREAITHSRKMAELKRDPEARDLWFSIYPQLSEGRPGMAGAIAARAEAHVTRLSLIYALLDRSAAIRIEHLQAALALWKYSEDSTKYLFGETMGDPVADQILKALIDAGANGMTRTEISDIFQRHVNGSTINRALNSLNENSRAFSTKEETGGRPTERWFSLSSTAKKAN